MSQQDSFVRRRFLKGLGGISIGLPLLDAFVPRGARASTAKPLYSVFILGHNGIAQNVYGAGREMFWPRTPGRLTKAGLAADKDRATSELADYADKLLLLRGIRYTFPSAADPHSGSSNQTFTASRSGRNLGGGRTMSGAESLDNRIARELNPEKREPLVLFVGAKPSYEQLTDNLSYRGRDQVRVGENNPWLAFQRLMGMNPGGGAAGNQEAMKALEERRKSVNDFVRGEVKALSARKELSQEDRKRLDQHFTSIRDLEVRIQNTMDPGREAAFRAVNGKHTSAENVETVIGLMTEIIALALASGVTRTAGLQLGSPTDIIRYTVDGKVQENFHYISHRIMSHGGSGAAIPDAERIHHMIDRIQLRALKSLLDHLDKRKDADGSMVDQGIYAYANALGDGPRHILRGIPYVSAGGARGYLKTGQFIDYYAQKKEPHNSQVLTTYLGAAGVRQANGAPADDFGARDTPRGPLTELLA
jgi:hypothetical protein